MTDDAIRAVRLASCLILTTIHAQDFKDEIGDRKQGRKTIATTMPILGRMQLAAAILIWAVVLPSLWNVTLGLRVLFCAVASIVGPRFAILRSVQADKLSYVIYNVSFLDAMMGMVRTDSR